MKTLFQAHSSAASSVSTGFVLPSSVPAPLFTMGQRVIWVEDYNNWNYRVIGKICGFHFVDHPDVRSGWSYDLDVEQSAIVKPDGSTERYTTQRIEYAPEHEIALTQQGTLTLVKLAG